MKTATMRMMVLAVALVLAVAAPGGAETDPPATDEVVDMTVWAGGKVVQLKPIDVTKADLDKAVKLSPQAWASKQVEMKKPWPAWESRLDKAEANYKKRLAFQKTPAAKKRAQRRQAKTSAFVSVFERVAATAKAAWCSGWDGKNVDTLRQRWIASRTSGADFDDTEGFEYELYSDGTPKVAYGFMERNYPPRAYGGRGYHAGMNDFTTCWFLKQVTHSKPWDCGHVIADSLGGPPDSPLNFFPQERWSNQHDVWYKHEGLARKLWDKGGLKCRADDIYLEVTFSYKNIDIVPDGGTYDLYVSKRCLDEMKKNNQKVVNAFVFKKHSRTGKEYGHVHSIVSWLNY